MTVPSEIVTLVWHVPAGFEGMKPVIHASPTTFTPVAGTPSNCTFGTPANRAAISTWMMDAIS